jgi:hypothetical protein
MNFLTTTELSYQSCNQWQLSQISFPEGNGWIDWINHTSKIQIPLMSSRIVIFVLFCIIADMTYHLIKQIYFL